MNNNEIEIDVNFSCTKWKIQNDSTELMHHVRELAPLCLGTGGALSVLSVSGLKETKKETTSLKWGS